MKEGVLGTQCGGGSVRVGTHCEGGSAKVTT